MSQETIWDNFYDVVILPPPHIRDYAIALSAQLSEHGTLWKLDAEKKKPHLSLFHFSLNTSHNIHDVAQTLEGIVRGGYVELKGISSPRHGAVFLDTTCPFWLITATETVAHVLINKYIAIKDPCFMERWQQLALTPRMHTNINTWRSPFMGDDFLPHFTLGVLPDHSSFSVANMQFTHMDAWYVDRLHVVQVGYGWTAGKILTEVTLV